MFEFGFRWNGSGGGRGFLETIRLRVVIGLEVQAMFALCWGLLRSSGEWLFHDEVGNVPTVKRIVNYDRLE